MPNSDMPGRDQRPAIMVAHEMPNHPKIAPLSDAAFRVLFRAWCYCSQMESDGRIPDAIWKQMGSAKARKELTDAPVVLPESSPLIIQRKGYVECHDYLAHQRSKREIGAMRSARSSSGELGAHRRWHIGRRRVDNACEFCRDGIE